MNDILSQQNNDFLKRLEQIQNKTFGELRDSLDRLRIFGAEQAVNAAKSQVGTTSELVNKANFISSFGLNDSLLNSVKANDVKFKDLEDVLNNRSTNVIQSKVDKTISELSDLTGLSGDAIKNIAKNFRQILDCFLKLLFES